MPIPSRDATGRIRAAVRWYESGRLQEGERAQFAPRQPPYHGHVKCLEDIGGGYYYGVVTEHRGPDSDTFRDREDVEVWIRSLSRHVLPLNVPLWGRCQAPLTLTDPTGTGTGTSTGSGVAAELTLPLYLVNDTGTEHPDAHTGTAEDVTPPCGQVFLPVYRYRCESAGTGTGPGEGALVEYLTLWRLDYDAHGCLRATEGNEVRLGEVATGVTCPPGDEATGTGTGTGGGGSFRALGECCPSVWSTLRATVSGKTGSFTALPDTFTLTYDPLTETWEAGVGWPCAQGQSLSCVGGVPYFSVTAEDGWSCDPFAATFSVDHFNVCAELGPGSAFITITEDL